MEPHRQSTALKPMLLAVMAKNTAAHRAANPREWTQLRLMRKRMKLSQEKFGAKVGLTQGMISQLENGDSDYTRSHIENFSEVLGCEPADLVASGDIANGEPVYGLLKDLPADERPRAIEILKTLKRTSRV